MTTRSISHDSTMPVSPSDFRPGRLWSLSDMLQVYAHEFFQLGARCSDAEAVFHMVQGERDAGNREAALTDEEKDSLRDNLTAIHKICRQLSLPVSENMIGAAIKALPETAQALDFVLRAVMVELKARLFLCLEPDRAPFWESGKHVSDDAVKAFPGASAEIRLAENAFAAGLDTACVFHAMRSAEVSLHAFAKTLGVTFPVDISLQQMQPILEQVHSKINALKALPKSQQKDEDLRFYSEAAAQLWYFKDGWRIRVMHGRAQYDKAQALSVLTHARELINALSLRLSE